MRSVVSTGLREDSKSAFHGADVAALIGSARMAIIAGADEEFLKCEELAELEITAAQFVILRNVLKGSAESACELCKVMDYDRGAMSRMIDRLEAKRLIRRVPLAHTRRSVALEVTPAGQAAFPVMEACLERVMNRLLKGISKSQVCDLEKVLRTMLANV
jgi:DNA-binding MarR family transcriptional regulator